MESLPPRAADALDLLESRLATADQGFSESQARAVLLEAEFDEEDATWLLELLHDRGYIYRVDDRIYLTEKSDVSS